MDENLKSTDTGNILPEQPRPDAETGAMNDAQAAVDTQAAMPPAETQPADTMTDPVPGARPALLALSHVNKNYGSKKVLDDLSFTIGRGGVIGLLGPNGSGKTTTIKLIAGLLVPNSGEILINGMAPSPATAAMISYLPERNFLPLGEKVSYLIDYFADFYRDFDRRKAYEMLGRLGVSEKERLKNLSKGTREKVQLILVMSRRAELYILDEPLGGVDPAARDYILDTILSNYSENGSILISTHLISDVERVLDDVIFMADGRAAFCASVKSIHEKHGKTVDELFREVYKC